MADSSIITCQPSAQPCFWLRAHLKHDDNLQQTVAQNSRIIQQALTEAQIREF